MVIEESSLTGLLNSLDVLNNVEHLECWCRDYISICGAKQEGEIVIDDNFVPTCPMCRDMKYCPNCGCNPHNCNSLCHICESNQLNWFINNGN